MLKDKLRVIHWFLVSQLGIDPLKFLSSFKGLFLYFRDARDFRAIYKGKITYKACLHDRFTESSEIRHEYFWQDLFVSRLIHEANPVLHVDIGSRVDGFVAHVATFRELEVFDVRDNSTYIPGVTFRTADITDSNDLAAITRFHPDGYCDSLSCLHAIEHFGLGRYGDRLLTNGLETGLGNMAALLRTAGRLYLSTPVGQERVEFNANWVFDPLRIIRVAGDNGLRLVALHLIDNVTGPHEQALQADVYESLANQPYNLGIFIFRKE